MQSLANSLFLMLVCCTAHSIGAKNSCDVKDYKLWGTFTNYYLVANENANSTEFVMPGKKKYICFYSDKKTKNTIFFKNVNQLE